MKLDYLDLIHRQILGELSPEEADQLRTWMESDAEHQRIYEETTLLLHKSEIIGGEILDGYQPDSERSYRDFKNSVDDRTKERSSISKRLMQFAAVASFAILASVGAIWYQGYTNTPMHYENLTEQPMEIDLPDGSMVWLNQNSKLSYDEGNGKRMLDLEGEAYFDVKKKKNSSFVINGGETSIEVLGTRFNFKTSKVDDSSRVDVEEGKVRYYLSQTPATEIFLLAGDQGRLTAADQKLVKTKTASSNFMAWKTGQLLFENSSLTQVLEDLEDHFEIEITFDEQHLASCIFTATFENARLPSILENLKLIFQIDIQQMSSTHYEISNGNCP